MYERSSDLVLVVGVHNLIEDLTQRSVRVGRVRKRGMGISALPLPAVPVPGRREVPLHPSVR